MKSKQIFKENNVLITIYAFVFLFLIFQKAIYSPDTFGYLKAMPNRHLGYVIFLKIFAFLFSDAFEFAVKVFQILFSLVSIHFFYSKVSQLLKLHILFKSAVLLVLLFPLFYPIYAANNLCPEGISYALYLLFVAFNLDFIFNENSRAFKFAIITFIMLVFTRGQFMFTYFIFAFIYILKYRSHLKNKTHVINLLILIFIPGIVIIGEMSYHKLKDGIFMTTPFGFTNMSSAAYYISEEDDAKLISNPEYKSIFKKSYNELKRKKLLMSSQSTSNYKENYAFFHNHIPQICNHTTYKIARTHFINKTKKSSEESKFTIAQSFYNAEKANKEITLILLKKNYKKWIQLYVANLSYSFYNSIGFVIMVILFIYSTFKVITVYHKWHALLFICTALSLSNAILIAIFSHSIMRYVFYNYALILLSLLIIFKIFRHGIKD
ncbi:hypothetical protein [uncultured Psychroserpens sp.]|uniref:hypothetical protein n=1 Tax=uncultured Psychroserpens sp. TaxID=255436 RepID=UPI0026075DF7|nr:hypothetical protein [uncultured Psychroserpens sp.]